MIDYYRAKKDILPLEKAAALPSDRQSPDEEAQTHFDLEAMRDAIQFLTGDQQQALRELICHSTQSSL